MSARMHRNIKNWGRRSAAVHKSLAPQGQVGDALVFDDHRVFDILAEADDYWIGRWWAWHKYFWMPVKQWYIRTYCTLSGRKWVKNG